MDRALGLKPEVTQGCGFESPLWQEVSTTEVRPLGKAPTLGQGTEPPTAPRALLCRLPTAPLGWVKCREHISLLIILCIIVYVTNKAHLSLICIKVLIYFKNNNNKNYYSNQTFKWWRMFVNSKMIKRFSHEV